MRPLNVSFHFYANDTQFYVSFKSSILGNSSRARFTLIRRRCWFSMLSTVLLPFSVNFNVATSSVTSSASAKNIGVLPNSTLSLDKHVTQICKSSFYSIRDTLRIRNFLSLQTAKILFHEFVTSKLDNCNSMLYGLPKNLLQRLQYVLNSAAGLVTMSRKSDHVALLLLFQLHWLPVEQSFEINVLLFYI